MNAHSSQFGGALVEEFLLAWLAAVGFVDHHIDSHLAGGRDYALNQLPRRWFQQGSVADPRHRVEAWAVGDDVGIEISHRQTLQAFLRRRTELAMPLERRMVQANHEKGGSL